MAILTISPSIFYRDINVKSVMLVPPTKVSVKDRFLIADPISGNTSGTAKGAFVGQLGNIAIAEPAGKWKFIKPGKTPCIIRATDDNSVWLYDSDLNGFYMVAPNIKAPNVFAPAAEIKHEDINEPTVADFAAWAKTKNHKLVVARYTGYELDLDDPVALFYIGKNGDTISLTKRRSGKKREITVGGVATVPKTYIVPGETKIVSIPTKGAKLTFAPSSAYTVIFGGSPDNSTALVSVYYNGEDIDICFADGGAPAIALIN